MKKRIFIGIDTSNYTTSLAIVNQDGDVEANLKRSLPVKEGERGLRQSDAVFVHIKNLPELMREAEQYLADAEIAAVGVSARPRDVDGSYMPCFLSGVAAAQAISSTHTIPLFTYSHQAGHIAAAIYSSGKLSLFNENFFAFHVSGGTTEILAVKPQGDSFNIVKLGGTADINAGQLIDRVGVLMDLPFPCGRHLEQLALQNTLKIPSRKPSVNGMAVNISGAENIAKSLLEQTQNKPLVSAFVLDYVYKSLLALAENCILEYGETQFLFAGGVMSNSIIKRRLSEKLNAFFAAPEFSADNAAGVAYLTYRKYILEN